MTSVEFNEYVPLVFRAIVIGVLGGVGLSLTSIYSRRGPLIYPVYAAILAALAMLLAGHGDTTFRERSTATLAGFIVATLISYVTVSILARKQRALLMAQHRLTPDTRGASVLGHVWHWATLLAIGWLVSAAVAFVFG